jgi:hypothetical protein
MSYLSIGSVLAPAFRTDSFLKPDGTTELELHYTSRIGVSSAKEVSFNHDFPGTQRSDPSAGQLISQEHLTAEYVVILPSPPVLTCPEWLPGSPPNSPGDLCL